MNTFEEKYLYKIKDLFEKYKGKMRDPELNEILDKGFVSSKPNLNAKILLCGINPSDNGKEEKNFHFHDLASAPYFRTLHDVVRECENKNSIDYLDLFCFRNTNQYDIWQFAKDSVGLRFVVDHLILTQEIIEDIQPKVILVFNKTAATFFGYHAAPDDANPTNQKIWMGYKLEDSSMTDNMYSAQMKYITGLHEGRMNTELKETSLRGSKIFFGSYMRYLKNEKKEELRKLIASLSKFE
ncbi:MAG TPA: hypothetical protein PKY63_09155 [Bacteroidales bacterium]|nr:hypothetical protein [Bacteroidales bacterium]